VEFKNSRLSPSSLIGSGGITKVNIISKEKQRTYIVHVVGKLNPAWTRFANHDIGYWISPFEIRDNNWRVTFLGTSRQVKKALNFIEKMEMQYKIVLHSDARFPQDSLLTTLTERQRKILSSASRLGYYDVPRKIRSEQLARTLGLSKSTLVEHLRKAERAADFPHILGTFAILWLIMQAL